MKIKLIILSLIFGFTVSSCHELELEPKGILGEPELFGTAFGVQKYFVQSYMNLPIEDFIYYANKGYMPGNNNSWQAYKNSLASMSGEIYGWNVNIFEAGVGYWPYDDIRIINIFINNFPNYKSKYDDATYNSLMGEARFLRAFFYQGMAKRYGGVPIITEVQDPVTTSAEDLQIPRASEYDTWKFIYEDLKFAMENMSAKSTAGRANKYVAAALMSRSMLYAGRIAKYTQYLGFESESAMQGGFVGIDPSKANEFFQYAYDAGLCIENGPYALYVKNYPDKATNFANLFLDKTSAETIFSKGYDGLIFGHCYDALMSPNPDFSSFVGAEGGPVLQHMQLYDFPALTDEQGKPVRFAKRSDIKNEMEPRLLGTCYFDGDELRGKKFDIQRGIYVEFEGTAADAQSGSNAASINSTANRKLGKKGDKYNGVLITGNHGMFENKGGENNAFMGAFIRKYIDVNLPTEMVRVNKSTTSWIVFRLGEIYLNTAEAAYELGKRSEAFDYVEAIRERAGCKIIRPDIDQATSSNYGYPIEASLQFIRDERGRELYCENHYWWDLKTWRITDQVLNNRYLRALACYYIFDEGKYIYLDEVNRDNRTKTAPKRSAYERIPQGEINKNPKLLPQNPLY
ncbi:MAG: RagB/SusD family nutrient uptake outer membrane protein [Bacteroidales bacterium]|nr:RagB/SusD family nutrient uptake outer membrane protein [Bacteroidales bacterium]